MKKILIAMIGMGMILACGTTAPTQPAAEAPAADTSTPFPSATTAPTSTAPVPTDTSQPTTAPNLGQHYAWNYIATQESGGVTVEIVRFVLADKATIDQDFDLLTPFDDRPVVAEIIFKITNTTDKIISIYPDQGKVIAGAEQVELLDFFLASFGDEFSGDIYPGVTVIGGMWLGFKRTSVDDITTVTIAFLAPFDENFNSLGPDFNIVLDLSTRQDQPLPDELK